ncbi:MAG: NBR1-Ig-like domain-containing protein [Chloroflexi bacterium]|nr:NBR1-Ig-like domain-containing protein [Chloroflexota bacterium]
MPRYNRFLWLIIGAGLIALAACSPKATPTPDANTVYTQVAGTVQAELAKSAALTPSPTATLEQLAATDVPPTAAPTVVTTAAATATLAPSATATTRASSPDKAEYVGQSIADNTKFDPGKTFTMKWTLKNVGTTTWTTSYVFRFYSGDQMGGKASYPFPKEVKPGDTIEIAASLTAPSKAGTYRGNWVLTNSDGLNFYPVYIDIVVGEPPPPTATSAPATATSAPPTNTPAAATQAPTAAPTITPTP